MRGMKIDLLEKKIAEYKSGKNSAFGDIYDMTMVVKAAFIILFVFRRSDENIAVPFVGEIPDIGNGNVHAFVFRALDERRKAIVVSADIDELPMVVATYSFQVVDVLCLKRLVVLAGVTSRRKFISEIFFEFCDFRHFV